MVKESVTKLKSEVSQRIDDLKKELGLLEKAFNEKIDRYISDIMRLILMIQF